VQYTEYTTARIGDIDSHTVDHKI